MYFRQTQTIKGLALRVAGAIHFEFDLPNNLSVILTRKEEAKNYDPSKQVVYGHVEGYEANPGSWNKVDELACIVHMQREISSKIQGLFTKLVSGKLDIKQDVSFPIQTDNNRSAPTYVKQASRVPEALDTFSTQIHKEMYEYAVKTLRVMRWRINATGPHNPVHGLISEFSFDDKNWLPLPLSPGFYFDLERDIRLTREIGIEIVKYVESGGDEPLAHVLLREAWNQRISNPRSALLIGISAAEIGLKQCISKLIPDAEWLVENLPTPPLITMLTEYIPRMPAKLKINNKVLPPPQEVIDTLKYGVGLRNKVIHTGKSEIKPGKLGEILNSIEDLLWLLDYYTGHDWALSHLRIAVKTSLGVKHEVNNPLN